MRQILLIAAVFAAAYFGFKVAQRENKSQEPLPTASQKVMSPVKALSTKEIADEIAQSRKQDEPGDTRDLLETVMHF